jgi:hypothetical protein
MFLTYQYRIGYDIRSSVIVYCLKKNKGQISRPAVVFSKRPAEGLANNLAIYGGWVENGKRHP